MHYATQHLEAVVALERAGRSPVFLPRAARDLDVGDSDTALVELEARYPGRLRPLNRYVMADRFLRNRPGPRQREHLARFALVFERLLLDRRPDLVVGAYPDVMGSWLGYDLAAALGIPTAALDTSTLPPGRLLLADGPRGIPAAREGFERMRRSSVPADAERAGRDLQRIVRDGTPLTYMPPPRRLAKTAWRALRLAIPRHVVRTAYWRFRERRAGNEFIQPDAAITEAKRPFQAVRAAFAERTFMTDAVPRGKFLFFPLHYEPETVILLHASYFENQLEIISNLARSLPADWQLVVKEHPQMRLRRTPGFYRRLRQTPGVALVPTGVPARELIAAAEVTAVIGGTAGLEASLLGRPVVMFGDAPWDHAPSIFKVGRLPDLPELLRHAAAADLGPDDPDVVAFAASWDAAFPDVRHYKHQGYDWLEPRNVERLADVLLDYWRSRSPPQEAPVSNASSS